MFDRREMRVSLNSSQKGKVLYETILLILYIQSNREPEQLHLVTDSPIIFKFFYPNSLKNV